jgi:hypothetical protein
LWFRGGDEYRNLPETQFSFGSEVIDVNLTEFVEYTKYEQIWWKTPGQSTK